MHDLWHQLRPRRREHAANPAVVADQDGLSAIAALGNAHRRGQRQVRRRRLVETASMHQVGERGRGGGTQMAARPSYLAPKSPRGAALAARRREGLARGAQQAACREAEPVEGGGTLWRGEAFVHREQLGRGRRVSGGRGVGGELARLLQMRDEGGMVGQAEAVHAMEVEEAEHLTAKPAAAAAATVAAAARANP